jgi:alginate O-acetyltransferase complex protein AlgI
MLTMVLGGLWHGANWTFILWGAWHGVLLAIERLVTKGKAQPYPRLIAWPLTMVFVIVGWVMFRAPTVSSAFAFYQAMLGFNEFGLSADVAWRLKTFDVVMLVAGIAVVIIAPRISVRDWAREIVPSRGVRLADVGAIALVGVSVIAVFKLAADSYSPFLYFQF